ncbi:MAG: ABC transporter ATP-binding protein, partial [Bacteroidales bacterium]|nr:ABC transporter ATP-binding protein [Bacteroidales bacterium]
NNCLAEFSMPLTLSRLDQLSLGQRKKVMLSFAIASGAKTILMDEPSNGLDIPSKAQFRKVMASAMTDDRLIVISTHQVHDVENLLDNIVIIDNDSILLNKSMGDLSEQLAFLTVAPGETVPEVLYSEPSIGGINVICNRQPDQDETQVNLEMLFNAVSKGLFKQ